MIQNQKLTRPKKKRTPTQQKAGDFLLRKALALLPLFSLSLSLYLSEPISVICMMIGAVLFHELGHLIAFSLATQSLPTLCLERFGIRLLPHVPLLPREEILVCLGGPLINILLGIVFCRYGDAFGVLFGGMHFLFAFFNLLPFETSDGGRILRILLLLHFSSRKTDGIMLFLSVFFLSFLFCLSLYTFYLTGNGLCGVFFSAFSFPWHALESKDDLRAFVRKKEFSGEKKS